MGSNIGVNIIVTMVEVVNVLLSKPLSNQLVSAALIVLLTKSTAVPTIDWFIHTFPRYQDCTLEFEYYYIIEHAHGIDQYTLTCPCFKHVRA